MRNIANVVHDLTNITDGLTSKLYVLTEKNTPKPEPKILDELLNSAKKDAQLIKDYLRMLKVEAQLNSLEKAAIDEPEK